LERLDPSKIIITKPVLNRTTSVKKTEGGSESLVIKSKISNQHLSKIDNKSKPKQQKIQQSSNYNRTQSPPPSSNQNHTQNHQEQQQQQQQQQQMSAAVPLKKIVLVCNLDPRATAEDVGVSNIYSND
jgi:hypothetical protein